MAITTTYDAMNNRMLLSVEVESIMSRYAPDVILREIAQQVAEKWVAENYQKVAALISPEAVATLTAAEAAARIRETLEKKIPDKVLEVVRTEKETEVWQRGVFGGMSRIR